MYKHVTTGSAANIAQGRISKAIITVNAALTGTITVSDETSTAGTPVVAVISNPTVGSKFEYWDFQTGLTVTPSTTCDITVNASSTYGK